VASMKDPTIQEGKVVVPRYPSPATLASKGVCEGAHPCPLDCTVARLCAAPPSAGAAWHSRRLTWLCVVFLALFSVGVVAVTRRRRPRSAVHKPTLVISKAKVEEGKVCRRRCVCPPLSPPTP
jgi:hypothetical protein